jgi:predicted  nucleic acid-binding Zn-ribbon protein
MSVEKLRSMALTYKDAITAKKDEIAKVADKLKEIPVAKMLGDEAKGLKTDIDSLAKSVSALKERFQVYYDKLKEKGGDLSGLTP